MTTRLIIALIAFIAIGNYCLGKDLRPKQGANGKYGFVDLTKREKKSFL
jgi:hypothetical protein